jgi:hypothetical protein
MRSGWLLLLGTALGCGASPTTQALCVSCVSDADCGGNPCFADGSGQRYCGRPCDSGCPAGFACGAVAGTSSGMVQTCYPTSLLCANTPTPGGIDLSGWIPDLGIFVGPPLDLAGVAPRDLASAPRDLTGVPPRDLATVPCTPPAGGTITGTGGTVDRLYFGYTGDTRPMSSTSSYPTQLQTVINNIFSQMKQQGVEFALDGGDHMEASSALQAQGNMANYASAAALLGKPVFMTMGNHECGTSFNAQDCGYAGAATADFKMAAFMTTLKQTSKQTSPYYRIDVMTQSGLAVFLVVADDAWNATQQAWLTAQLNDADVNAKYTFVSKHHPDGNTDQPAFQQIYDLVRMHKYTLFLTGHSHEYKHQFGDPRAVVMGLGGAPFDNPMQMWWGYLTVMQCPNDQISVTVYDQATGTVRDNFSLPPQ